MHGNHLAHWDAQRAGRLFGLPHHRLQSASLVVPAVPQGAALRYGRDVSDAQFFVSMFLL
ncbi:hypothetical protein ACFTZ8_35120 [Streptomyces fungicidicus]|uniref:hypothetical protein n=1 Tax=Streptomyces fungicidicus TaxID=68203 RepID=UPI003638D069